jgi:hypothetical protein
MTTSFPASARPATARWNPARVLVRTAASAASSSSRVLLLGPQRDLFQVITQHSPATLQFDRHYFS